MVFEFSLRRIHSLCAPCLLPFSLPTSGSLLQLDALPVWGWSGGEREGAGAASPPVPCCACLRFIRPAVLSPVGAFPPSPLCFSLSCLLLASSSLGLCLSSFLL